MDDIKVWAGLIGQFGVPIVITLWYFLYERPAQRKREDDIQARADATLERVLKSQREDSEGSRGEDRKHTLEIQKLAGDIHKATTDSLVTAMQSQGKEIGDLGEKISKDLERALDVFTGKKRGQ